MTRGTDVGNAGGRRRSGEKVGDILVPIILCNNSQIRHSGRCEPRRQPQALWISFMCRCVSPVRDPREAGSQDLLPSPFLAPTSP